MTAILIKRWLKRWSDYSDLIHSTVRKYIHVINNEFSGGVVDGHQLPRKQIL